MSIYRLFYYRGGPRFRLIEGFFSLSPSSRRNVISVYYRMTVVAAAVTTTTTNDKDAKTSVYYFPIFSTATGMLEIRTKDPLRR